VTSAPGVLLDKAARIDIATDCCAGDRRRCLPTANRPRDTEIDRINEVARRNEDIRRLDVAVNEAVGVSGIQSLGYLTKKINRPLGCNRAIIIEQHSDIDAVHQAHVDE
jgi:hypothetical protein